MKFSEKWLREWVNPNISAEELTEQMTMLGLEVDACEAVSEKFDHVIIGEVVSADKHPDADKLQITKVNIGEDRLLDIVCGASNCRAGLKVACAVEGATLPNNLIIKKTKLRGQISEGMLCSYKELGISIESSGIIELPTDAPIGKSLFEYMQLNNNMIEIGVTPNRADCLSIKGIAREVGVVNNLAVTQPFIIEPTTVTIKDKIDIKLENPSACPRYLGRLIKNININATTPLWLKEKLRICGIRAIDPIVDVTNYVLLELGQPMHAFDADKIQVPLVVRNAKPQEQLKLLDGKEILLDESVLVIADQSKALAMAGIFGGLESGVSSSTKSIILESAFFNPISIIGKARAYGLQTDSSYRFERGVDFNLQHMAMERATNLITEICGGEVGEISEACANEFLPSATTITLTKDKLDKLIGYNITAPEITNILSRLGFNPTYQIESDTWIVKSPSWRFDISIEEDLIEEVVRVYGYNKIPNTNPLAKLAIKPQLESQISVNTIKSILVNKGYQETITYSFVDPNIQAKLFPEKDSLALPNPISVEMSAMRVSLVTGLINVAIYNQNRQISQIKLFETGLRFIPDTKAELGVAQELVLSALISGNNHTANWYAKNRIVDFYDLKGDLESILAIANITNKLEFKIQDEYAFLHPHQSAKILLNQEEIGFIGALHPTIIDYMGLTSNTIIFELQLEKILHKDVPKAKMISKFPANKRDIAIIIDDNILSSNVVKLCEKAAGNLLQELNIFDTYRGENIGVGKKSIAISLILQDHDKTLTEEEISKVINNVTSTLESELNANVRI